MSEVERQVLDRRSPLCDAVAEAKRLFQERHPGSGFGFPSDFDYARYSLVFERLDKGGGVLDVGVGSGQLVNALALSGHFQRVCGIDVQRHSRFTRFSDRFEMRQMSVAAMQDFADGEFDAVVCMEVLEHLEPAVFEQALAELRRVCARQLVMSVPYDEPEPLPSYHKMRFGDEELANHFPTAELLLLVKPRVSWMLIEERP